MKRSSSRTSRATRKPPAKPKAGARTKPVKKTPRTRPPARKPAAAARPAAPVGPRRAVFIDVENASNEASLLRVIEELKIDRAAQPTELIAVGNWRTAAQGVARRLGELGA